MLYEVFKTDDTSIAPQSMVCTKSMFENPRREFANFLVTEDFMSASWLQLRWRFLVADSVYRERVAPEEGSSGQPDFK